MSITKKNDVKNHVSPRNYNGIHLYRPATQPDATGFSGEQSGSADSNTSSTVEDPPNKVSASRPEKPPATTGLESNGVATTADSKSAQA
jgi:hypothetical protein